MRVERYYAGNEKVDPKSVGYVSRRWWDLDGVPGVPFPGGPKVNAVPVGRNAAGERVVVRLVRYKHDGSKHACGSKCRHAKGPNCECSCGGANHGAGG